MKDVSNSATIKSKKNILTYIFRTVKLTLIGFLSLLAWGLHLTGSGINIIVTMITKKKGE